MPFKASSVAKGKGRAIPAAAATTPASSSKQQTSQKEQVDNTADDGEDSDEDSDDEEDDADVDESAMAKLMDMLGDVDPEELGFAPEDLEDDEDDKQHDDEDDEDVDSALEDEDLDAESVDSEENGELDLGDDDQDAEVDTATVSRPQDTANPKFKSPSVEQRRQNQILEGILKRFKLDLPFFESQTLTYPEKLDIPDISDDLSRELQFYKQSLWAAQHAYKLFKSGNVPFQRPNDYFAEMLKTDDHMERIRQKLLDESASIKASEAAKKQRHLKKFGKQVQVEKQREREKAKRDLNDKVASFKKKRKGNPAGGDNDGFDIDTLDAPSQRGRPAKRARTGKTRDQRDSKFGHAKAGGRRPKENDRESANDIFSNGPKAGRGSGGSRGGRGGRGGMRGGMAGRGGGGKSKRLGKSRRK